MNKKKPINFDTEIKIRISSKEKKELKILADLYNTSISSYIRELIRKNIENSD